MTAGAGREGAAVSEQSAEYDGGLRCPAQDPDGQRCRLYRGHEGEHGDGFGAVWNRDYGVSTSAAGPNLRQRILDIRIALEAAEPKTSEGTAMRGWAVTALGDALESADADLLEALRKAQSANGATQAVLERAVPDEDARAALWRDFWRDRLATLSTRSSPGQGRDQ